MSFSLDTLLASEGETENIVICLLGNDQKDSPTKHCTNGSGLDIATRVRLRIDAASTATEGDDFSAFTKLIDFDAGDIEKEVPIQFIADRTTEGVETLRVRLEAIPNAPYTISNPANIEFVIVDTSSGAKFLNVDVFGYILPANTCPTGTKTPVPNGIFYESNGSQNLVLIIDLENGPATVSFQALDGTTATAGTDFTINTNDLPGIPIGDANEFPKCEMSEGQHVVSTKYPVVLKIIDDSTLDHPTLPVVADYGGVRIEALIETVVFQGAVTYDGVEYTDTNVIHILDDELDVRLQYTTRSQCERVVRNGVEQFSNPSECTDINHSHTPSRGWVGYCRSCPVYEPLFITTLGTVTVRYKMNVSSSWQYKTLKTLGINEACSNNSGLCHTAPDIPEPVTVEPDEDRRKFIVSWEAPTYKSSDLNQLFYELQITDDDNDFPCEREDCGSISLLTTEGTTFSIDQFNGAELDRHNHPYYIRVRSVLRVLSNPRLCRTVFENCEDPNRILYDYSYQYGDWTEPVCARLDDGSCLSESAVPEAPTLTVSPRELAIELFWNEVAGAEKYEYRYRPSSKPNNKTLWRSISCTYHAEGICKSKQGGLNSTDKHIYQVRGVNAHNAKGVPSVEVGNYTLPSAPINLDATWGIDSVFFTWSHVADLAQSSIVRHDYRIREENQNFDPWIAIPDSGGVHTTGRPSNFTSYRLQNLPSGTTHYLQVRTVGNILLSNELVPNGYGKAVQVVGTTDSVDDPLPTQQCGDGTVVEDRFTDCKDCWDGSNIPSGNSCPQGECGDGTVVDDPATQCKNCWDGSNIHVDTSCPARPSQQRCGDGTPVGDFELNCKDCWDGTNIHKDKSCPVQPPAQQCGDGTPVYDSSRDCQDCWDGTNIPVGVACPPRPEFPVITAYDGTITEPTRSCYVRNAADTAWEIKSGSECTDAGLTSASPSCMPEFTEKCWIGTGRTSLQIYFTMSKTWSQEVRVQYQTVNGTAIAGEDFEHASGTATFTVGDRTSSAFSISILPENGDVGDETFYLELSDPYNAVIDENSESVTVTIEGR